MLGVPLKNFSNHGFSALELNNCLVTSVGATNHFASRDHVRVSDLVIELEKQFILPNIFMKLRNKITEDKREKQTSSRATVEPRFNEVPRDWGNLFVISRVCYIENLHITNLSKTTKMFVLSRCS